MSAPSSCGYIHVMMQALDTCGSTRVPTYPEEFWNCFDLRILPTGTRTPPPPPAGSARPPPPPPPRNNCTGGTATCFCSDKPDGFYANPDSIDGSTYISCGGGNTKIQDCPLNTIFNDAEKACLAPPPPPPPASKPSHPLIPPVWSPAIG
jgi:hypothetical protein